MTQPIRRPSPFVQPSAPPRRTAPPIRAALAATIAVAMSVAMSVAMAAFLTACQGPTSAAGYFGPTQSLPQVIRAVNANSAAVPSLWSHAYFEATLVDPKDHSNHFINGDGVLLYQSPNQMRLTATKDFADLIDMGCDGAHFWLWQKKDNQFWWGDLGQAAPASQNQDSIPIRPDLFMQVLGVLPIDPVLTDLPAPVMRFNNDADVYMVVWQTRLADRWVAQKEIWFDRATLMPSKVLLFDPDGRVQLRASLQNDVAIASPAGDNAQASPPRIASRFLIFFPPSGTHLSMTLKDPQWSHNGFPKPISFRMPDPAQLQRDGVKVIRIDEKNAD